MVLMQSQRNAIFEEIQRTGTDPTGFEWESFEGGDGHADVDFLTHTSSGYHFGVSLPTADFRVTFTPGFSTRSEEHDPIAWSRVLEYVRIWLSALHRELEAPDLWAELEGEREALSGGAVAEVENTPFTSDEQGQIARQLEEAKHYVRHTYELPADHCANSTRDSTISSTRVPGCRDSTGVMPP
jgi:hypothetical protein